MTCRICLEDEGELIQPCECKGTAAYVHPECLIKWLNISETTQCEICKYEYTCEEVLVTQSCKNQCQCTMSHDKVWRRSLYLSGLSMLAVILLHGWYYPNQTATIFLCMNILQFIFICMLSYFADVPLNILAVLAYFKTCTTIGLSIVAFKENYWTFAYYEMCLLVFTLFMLYIHVFTTNRYIVQRQILI